MQSRSTIYYTRCPVPTASGVAFQSGMFAEAFAGSEYDVRNITELGADAQNVHYTHSIDAFFREGGGAPPVWARANGVDSVLLGMTFVEEMLGIFVRVDDPAQSMAELAGARVAIPVWPRLVFNFWRFLVLHGFGLGMAEHGLSLSDVQLVNVTEDWDPSERRNVDSSALAQPARCEYRNQMEALLSGRVDAIWGKGLEAALLVGEGAGRIRLLYDLRFLQNPELLKRASIPRLLTTSRRFLTEHPQAVVDYIRTLIRASRWADAETESAKSIIARECGVDSGNIDGYVGPQLRGKLLPRITPAMTESLQSAIDLLHELKFTERRFCAAEWIEASPLMAAYESEQLPWTS